MQAGQQELNSQAVELGNQVPRTVAQPPRFIGAGKYRVARRIGAGSFGVIHRGIHQTSGEVVAIKFESVRARHPQLLYEAKIYKMLGGQIGIPAIYWWGVEGEWTAIVIELLGASLEDVFSTSNRKLSLRTVLLLGEQMLNRIELLHEFSYLHRDIKPDNFLLGSGRPWKIRAERMTPNRPRLPSGARTFAHPSSWEFNSENAFNHTANIVYMCDFGLCKRYRDAQMWRHVMYRTGKSLTGTARYCSLATHQGVEQGRRDDVEALGYVLLYLRLGALPWQGLPANTKEQKYTAVMNKKASTTIRDLCRCRQGEHFADYFAYVRQLQFEERPNYDYLRSLLLKAYTEENFPFVVEFDWSQSLENNDATMMRLFNHEDPNVTLSRLRESMLIPYIPTTSASPAEGVAEEENARIQKSREALTRRLESGERWPVLPDGRLPYAPAPSNYVSQYPSHQPPANDPNTIYNA